MSRRLASFSLRVMVWFTEGFDTRSERGQGAARRVGPRSYSNMRSRDGARPFRFSEGFGSAHLRRSSKKFTVAPRDLYSCCPAVIFCTASAALSCSRQPRICLRRRVEGAHGNCRVPEPRESDGFLPQSRLPRSSKSPWRRCCARCSDY